MKRKDLEILLQKINVDLYAYSYGLVPDERFSAALVSDAIMAATMDRRMMFEELLDAEDEKEKRIALFGIKKLLYRTIFQLATKRYSQLRAKIQVPDELTPFHGLNLEQKSALFLKRRTSFDMEDIQEILGVNKVELISLLSTARQLLAVRSGVDSRGVFA
jgi:hypothetical protein